MRGLLSRPRSSWPPPSWRAKGCHPRLASAAGSWIADARPSPTVTIGTWLVRAACIIPLLLSIVPRSLAVEPSELLADPKLEARAEAIGATLRCLVCQNESIEESNASLAHDIRVLLRQLLAQGDTDAQARQAIVARYGEFVLLQPPVQPATYVLWFGPPAILLFGFAGIVLWLRRRPATTASVAPLSPQEQSRLEALLREADR